MTYHRDSEVCRCKERGDFRLRSLKCFCEHLLEVAGSYYHDLRNLMLKYLLRYVIDAQSTLVISQYLSGV